VRARLPTRGEEGSVTIWMLGVCIMVLFLGGISLDLWRVFVERRDLAARVDAAAIAGASGIDEAAFRDRDVVVLDPDRAEAMAWDNLRSQDPDPSLVSQAIAATPDQITVTATGTVRFTLLGVLLPNDPFTVRVSATVSPEGSP